MISITCTNCRAVLEIDDAFAGGVCRCQHCGTIQTVPAHLKGKGRPAAVGAAGASKTLYQNARQSATGLDDLSDAVLSSGLSRSALTSKKSNRAPAAPPRTAPGVDYATPQQQKKKPILWIVLGAVAGALLMAVVAFLFIGRSSVVMTVPPTGPGGTGGAGGITGLDGGDDSETVAVPKGPHFCGLDLNGATGVVYLLDRGSATGELFDTLKAATYQSVQSLRPDQKFAIIFWDNGSGEAAAYPAGGLAMPNQVTEADRQFEDVVAFGRSDPTSAIKAAAEREPSDVILVTGKADDLPPEVVGTVQAAFPGDTKVHAVALEEDYGNVLKDVAAKKNGTHKIVRSNQLRDYSREK